MYQQGKGWVRDYQSGNTYQVGIFLCKHTKAWDLGRRLDIYSLLNLNLSATHTCQQGIYNELRPSKKIPFRTPSPNAAFCTAPRWQGLQMLL
jgi:hypothetical protein